MKKIIRNFTYMACLAVMICMSAVMAGCRKEDTGSQANNGFSDGQVMVIASSEKKRYEQLFSADIWEVPAGPDQALYKDVLKGQIHQFCDRLVLIDTVAGEQGISLSEEEAAAADEMSRSYLEALTADELAAIGISAEDSNALFRAYALADKTAVILGTNMNLEVSETEAKVIRIIEAASDDVERLKRFQSALEGEEEDFVVTAGKLGIATQERLLGRKEEDEAYEEAVFALDDGEVSDILRKGDSLLVVKCVDDYDEKATAERKALIYAERQKRGFEKLIDEYSERVAVKYSSNIWSDLDLAQTVTPETADFFEFFDEYREKVKQ